MVHGASKAGKGFLFTVGGVPTQRLARAATPRFRGRSAADGGGADGARGGAGRRVGARPTRAGPRVTAILAARYWKR